MKRSIAILAAAMVASSLVAGPAMAKPEKFEESHGHMLVIKLQVEPLTVADGVPYDGVYLTGYGTCVDMPVTPLRAHHENIHYGDGTAADGRGINIRGLRTAGHAFIPSSNHPSPWASCAELADSLPFPLSPPPPADE